MTSLPEEGNAVNFGTLERYTALERIKKYNNALLSNFLFNFTKFKRSKYAWYLGAVPSAIHWFIFGESWTINTTAQLCIVPLYRVNDYKIQLGGNIFINTEKTNNETHQHTSDEAIVSMNKKNTSGLSHSRIFRQGGTVMEVAIHYKWKMFARMRFFVILFVHMIYYISYTAAITFPQELYNYEPGSAIEHKQHFLSIALMFVSVYALLLQEFTEFISRTLEYFSSFYNWVDLAAFALPIVAFVLLLTGNDLLVSLYTPGIKYSSA
jgi:hypothetical protein